MSEQTEVQRTEDFKGAWVAINAYSKLVAQLSACKVAGYGVDQTERDALEAARMAVNAELRRLEAEVQALRGAVPAGMMLVSTKLLKRAERSLGSFCSDEGWGAADMEVMDDISAALAAAPQPAAQPTYGSPELEQLILDRLAQKAQPAAQQQPAAWWNGEWTTPVIAFSRDTPGIGLKNPNAVPLYTRPAVPLTDEQIEELASRQSNRSFARGAFRFCSDFARAIEAAHKIGCE